MLGPEGHSFISYLILLSEVLFYVAISKESIVLLKVEIASFFSYYNGLLFLLFNLTGPAFSEIK